MNLLDAIQARDDEAIEAILQARPDAGREKGPDGQSAILLAIYQGQPELAARLAAHASPDLCEAAALGDPDLLTSLLDAGAAVDQRSFDGWTALHLAAFTGQTKAARILVGHGAPLDAISANYMANTPLCAALAGAGAEELVVFLLESGADARARVATGVTPLHLAASRGRVDLVRLLLEAGADATATMDDGTTPAAMATARGHPQVARFLESGGTQDS